MQAAIQISPGLSGLQFVQLDCFKYVDQNYYLVVVERESMSEGINFSIMN